ncbi:MAG: hypothetical protein C0404_09540 [Verrucomicrobia bacterium]|nr:hypothetical protein [Verrucomicrobiota bacterium]
MSSSATRYTFPIMKEAKQTIRGAEFRDVESIFRLIKTYPSELLPRAVSDIIENIDRFLVCDFNGHIVGCVSWQILPELRAPLDPSVEIKSLAIKKSLRRAGIGTKLVLAAIRRVQQFHPAQIIALTFAPGFFRKLGFKKVAKRKLMHKIYLGCANCSKYDSPFTCPEIAMAMKLRDF